MNYKRLFRHSLFKTLVLFLALLFAAFSLVKQWYAAEIILVPLIGWLLYDSYKYHQRAATEIGQFVESIRHRDFSRHFNPEHVPSELQPLRHGFNEIISTFKLISKEKETQFLYLKISSILWTPESSPMN